MTYSGQLSTRERTAAGTAAALAALGVGLGLISGIDLHVMRSVSEAITAVALPAPAPPREEPIPQDSVEKKRRAARHRPPTSSRRPRRSSHPNPKSRRRSRRRFSQPRRRGPEAKRRQARHPIPDQVRVPEAVATAQVRAARAAERAVAPRHRGAAVPSATATTRGRPAAQRSAAWSRFTSRSSRRGASPDAALPGRAATTPSTKRLAA